MERTYETVDQLINKLRYCGSRDKAIEAIKNSNSIARVCLMTKHEHLFRKQKIVNGRIEFTDDFRPEKMSAATMVDILENNTDLLDY